MKSFEELNVRKLSKEVTVKVYGIFSQSKDFGFKDQIQRASISIMNNIAEGFERGSLKDKQRFFTIAKSSCGEVRSMLHIGYELHYFQEDEYVSLLDNVSHISSMLWKLIDGIKF